MDDSMSDNGKCFEITAKHAALVPSLPNVKSLMAYVEAVAVVIGSRHIHSVYEDRGNMKIYLTQEKFVDILVNSGVTILGRHVNVDYAVPRADKVILSNVDPIIPDLSLLHLLSFYGTPASTIIHDKIATNSEYSHIECGSRKVYMNIFDGKKLPAKIKFTFQSICYHIDVIVEQFEKHESNIPSSVVVEDVSDDDALELDSLGSLKPNIGDMGIKQPTPKQLAYWNRRSEERKSAALAARQIKRRVKKRWLKSKVRRVRGMAALLAGEPFEGGAIAMKPSSPIRKKLRKGVRQGLMKKPVRRVSNITNTSQDVSMDGADNVENVSNTSLTDSVTGTPSRDISTIIQYPLTTEELEKFMFKTRFHREPLQVAADFLAEKEITDGMGALEAQLMEYRSVCKEVSIKLRIKRLISLLKNAAVDKGVV